MQRAKKLCAFMLVLCLVVGFIPANVFAAESKTEVVGQQLYLGDDLTMHFYVSISGAHKADGVMNVAVSGGSVDYQIQNMTANSDGNYVFSVELGAPQMTEDITLTLTSGGEKILENVYSIQDYAHYLLENNYTSETKALVKEMLNYGAKAQLLFGHNTTDLANEGYAIESTGTIDTVSPEIIVAGAVDGINFYGCSMVFESKIAIRYYFTTASGIEGYTFTVDGENAEPVQKNDMYYIEIDGIAPDAMDTLRTVKVAKDDAELSVQYCPVYYITRMYNRASTSQELKDLLVAAKGYFDAAKVFTGVAKNTLTITELGSGSANAQFFNVNVANNLSNYTVITDKCNEETHILIDGQPWTSNAEIKTGGPKTLVFKGMNGVVGTKLTILEGFSVTFGDVTYVTDKEYNYWWDGSKWGTEEVIVVPTISIVEMGNGSANAQFINVSVANTLPDYTIITDKCNEETHILIDGQPWTSNAEIKTAGAKTLVFKGMNGSKGTKLTILEGFSVTFGDVTYFIDKEYNFWWDGTKWGTEEVEAVPTISIVELGSGSYNAQFFNVNVANDLADYTDITASCNEETHVLIDDAPWTGSPVIKTGGKNVLVFTGLNGSKGTKLTILEGFSVTLGDVTYFIDKEYNFWWDGTKWGTEEVEAVPTISIVEMGNGSANAQFINVSVANSLPDYTIITDKCNEETHILIDGQPWTSNAEIKTAGAKTLVFKGMNGSKGTKLTILEGFSVTFGDVTYFIDKEYNFWWDGSKWGTEEVESVPTISIVEMGNGSANAQFINVSVANTLPDYTIITDKCNEETHILIDGQPWTSNAEIKTAGAKTLVFKGMNGSKGTKLTILEGFTVTFGDVTYFIDKEYNFWWDGTKWGTEEVEAVPTISIVEMGTGSANAQFINVSVANTLPDYTIITDKCNEETHILIDGQPWTNAEIKTGGAKTLVFKGMNGVKGTKLTILEGFSITFGDVTYFIDKEYNFWWDGSKWGTAEVEKDPPSTLTIVGAGTGVANTIYLQINAETGLADWTNIAAKANEETHILIDDQAWSTQEIGAISGKSFYINNIGADYGTKVTIKKGFTVTFNGITYVTEQDYNFWWNGAGWATENPVVPEKIWKEMPLGVFGSPYASQAAYDECADAGFNFVLIDENYGAIDTLDYKNILKYCLQAGMNPIAMTFEKNNMTDFSAIPGFAGKFFYDEPSAAEFSTIASWIDGFEGQGYSNGIFMNNLYPSYAGESSYGTETYEEYLEGYIDQVLSKVNGPKWLSVDFYPLWMKTTGATNVHAEYLYNLEATAQAALAHKDMDLTVHYFVQTHGFGDQEWNVRDLSSIADIRYQYNCAMAYGVNAFSVFTYPTQGGDFFGNGSGLVTNNGDGTTTKNDAYYYVQQANNELKAWDEIYLSYDYEGTMAIGKSSGGKNQANMLKHNLATLTGASVLSASNDTLIGQFDKNGSKAYMVSNYSNPANGENDNVIMTFANGTALQVIKNGVTEDITVSNGILTLNLGAGEAAFVIVK